MVDLTYHSEFRYSDSKNPYNEKLRNFPNFVMTDHEAEVFRGVWNKKIFKREAPLCLEIGSGYGHFMLDYCAKNPEINFVGLDYRFKRSFNLAKKLNGHTVNNFRYLRTRGERLRFIFDDNELDNIFYFFPDPWYKNKHQKRRLFQKHFLQVAYETLKPTGKIFIKTDHDGLAEWMEEVILSSDLFRVLLSSKDLRQEYPEHFLSSFKTKFEKIFIEQGKTTKAFVLESNKVLH